MKVQTDIMNALDRNEVVILVLLDLSSAFDTVDHTILLDRLKSMYGIDGDALAWFKSYLTGRTQTVVVGAERSDDVIMNFGVLQGSVLGPKEFCLYTKPLGSIISKHGLQYHLYADDSQIYTSCQPDQVLSTIKTIETCIDDIRIWMKDNKLKLNDSKTEIIMFGTKQRLKAVGELTVRIGDASVSPTKRVRNLGVLYDSQLNMDKHIGNVSRTCYMHLNKIGRIRKYLTPDATRSLVNATFTARLDYANSLLYGITKHNISKLQRIQNTSARIITQTRKYEHITPILMELHWLPVFQRINFKILIQVYKAQNELSLQYVRSMVREYVPGRSLRSADHFLLETPRSTTSYGKRTFEMATGTLWNELPIAAKHAKSLNIFKKLVKTFLFNKVFNN